MSKQPKVLFLATGDASRGQMAEGFLCAMAPGVFKTANTAVESTGCDRLTDEVMREAGVDISRQKPMRLAQSLKQHFGYVITIFDSSREKSPVFPFTLKLLRWDLRDPEAETESPQRGAAFRRTREEIRSRVREFLSDLNQQENGRVAA